MTLQTLKGSLRSRGIQAALLLLVFIYLAVNAMKIGGDEFVIALNNNIAIPLAVAVVGLTVSLWQRMAAGPQNRWLWTGLAIGWGLWTVAELWWSVASMLGQEVPYPSWADFFWLVGYIPMYVALWARIRSLPRFITFAQNAGLWLVVLLTFGLTAWYILLPIILKNDPSAVIESTLNILYPLVDLTLLLMVLRIFFAYQQGKVGLAWGWLSAGFVAHSISNLLFSYVSTYDLYYPQNQVTLLSSIGVDVPYNLSYLLWLIGLWILREIHYTPAPIWQEPQCPPIPNTHLLAFTRADGTVIEVSNNYSRVFALENAVGASLAETLGLSTSDAEALLRESRVSHTLPERAISVQTRFGIKQAHISGTSVVNPQGEYSGLSLLVRLCLDEHSLDELLPHEQKRMVHSILQRSGTKEKEDAEIFAVLSIYYQAHLRGLYQYIFNEGGASLADTFLAEMQDFLLDHGWMLDIHPEDAGLDLSHLSRSQIHDALPALLETARRFVRRVSEPAAVASIAQEVSSRFDASTQILVDTFEKNKD